MQATLVHVIMLNNHHTTFQQTITTPDLLELDKVAESAGDDPGKLSQSPSAKGLGAQPPIQETGTQLKFSLEIN